MSFFFVPKFFFVFFCAHSHFALGLYAQGRNILEHFQKLVQVSRLTFSEMKTNFFFGVPSESSTLVLSNFSWFESVCDILRKKGCRRLSSKADLESLGAKY